MNPKSTCCQPGYSEQHPRRTPESTKVRLAKSVVKDLENLILDSDKELEKLKTTLAGANAVLRLVKSTDDLHTIKGKFNNAGIKNL